MAYGAVLSEMRDASQDNGLTIEAGGDGNITSVETDRAGANLLKKPSRDSPVRLIRPDVVHAGIDERHPAEGDDQNSGR
jgi:hypothetical protein